MAVKNTFPIVCDKGGYLLLKHINYEFVKTFSK